MLNLPLVLLVATGCCLLRWKLNVRCLSNLRSGSKAGVILGIGSWSRVCSCVYGNAFKQAREVDGRCRLDNVVGLVVGVNDPG